MDATLYYSGELVVETCWCGTRHAVPAELRKYQQAQFDRGDKPISIYCPLGHAWVPSGKSALDRERERARSLEARLVAAQDQAQAERRSHSATKGQLTRERKRAAAGVCPCCNRSFVQLARHMKSQHPDFASEATTDDGSPA